MKFVVFSVRDVKADSFGAPQYARSVGEAIRGFQDEINRSDPQNIWFKHPEDFDLYVLGFYETDDGTFELLAMPQLQTSGSSAKIAAN